jgi:glycosyltransferase involved in cell wall biosynthesis
VPERSVLLVAQLAPPSPLIAARRVAGLTKYLARLGYRISVLTSRISGDGPIEGAFEVFRTGDLMASPLNWRRRQFAALSGRNEGTYARPSRLEAVVVPDIALFSWLPLALPRALSLARSRGFDCVITTSPPPSVHLVGRSLRASGIRWIAELRDGWTFEPPRAAWPFATQQRLDRALEAAVLKRADAAVAVTEPIAADLRRRLHLDARVITNGFDSEESRDKRDGSEPEPLLAAGKHSFVHTGRIGVTGTELEPLLAALRLLRTEEPEVSDRIEVVLAGPLSEVEAKQLDSPDLSDLIRVVGVLPRRQTLSLQRAADTLLVITQGDRRNSVATGKLFEYLAADRPVLVLGDETEAARIVTQSRSGFGTSAEDPEAIARALVLAVEGEDENPERSSVERYSYASLAHDYALVIEDVCGRRLGERSL